MQLRPTQASRRTERRQPVTSTFKGLLESTTTSRAQCVWVCRYWGRCQRGWWLRLGNAKRRVPLRSVCRMTASRQISEATGLTVGQSKGQARLCTENTPRKQLICAEFIVPLHNHSIPLQTVLQRRAGKLVSRVESHFVCFRAGWEEGQDSLLQRFAISLIISSSNVVTAFKQQVN